MTAPRSGSNQLPARLNPKGETERVTQREGGRRGRGRTFHLPLRSDRRRPTGRDSSSRLPSVLVVLLSSRPLSFSGALSFPLLALFPATLDESTHGHKHKLTDV